MRVGFAALAVLVVVVLATPARADQGFDANSVGVIVQGGGSLRDRVEQHLTDRVRKEGYTPVEEKLVLTREALSTLANCFIIEDLVCARGLVEARGKTPRVVFARIDDTTGSVIIDITWFSYGRAPIAKKTSCSKCEATWRDHTDDLMQGVLDKAEMPVLPTEPDPDARPKRPPSLLSRLFPRVLVGIGAATLVTGSVLLYYGLRSGEEHKYVYPSLTPVGITLIAVGGGAVIGGMITW